MKSSVLFAVTFAIAGSSEANAAQALVPQPVANTACFEITNATQGGIGLVLLNKCTGATWLLVRHPLSDNNGRPTGDETYQWHPVQTATDPPVLKGNSN